MINIVGETLEKHSDAEVIDHLNTVMKGVIKNYKTAVEKNEPEVLFGCLGDIVMVSSFLSAIKKKNDERLAQSQK